MHRDIALFSLVIWLLSVGASAQNTGRRPVHQPTLMHRIIWVILKQQPMAEAAGRWQPALRQRREGIDSALRVLAGNPTVPPNVRAGAHMAARHSPQHALTALSVLEALADYKLANRVAVT